MPSGICSPFGTARYPSRRVFHLRRVRNVQDLGTGEGSDSQRDGDDRCQRPGNATC